DPRLKQLRVMGKGAKMRVVPVEGEARKALKRYLEIRPRDETQHTCISRDTNSHLHFIFPP
ncbi:unnamed protein product, partial [marine sediment metagenome]